MAKIKKIKPSVGLFILIILLILLLIFSSSSPEKEKKLKDELIEKKRALEIIVENIAESKEFKAQLLADKKKTTLILRIVVFGIVSAINIAMLYILDCRNSLKDAIECVGLVSATISILTSSILFIRYGEFAGIQSAYDRLQAYILKLRYDETEEQIEAYLTAQLEDRETLIKEIKEIERQLKQLENGQTPSKSVELLDSENLII